jgi:hypothetical protein
MPSARDFLERLRPSGTPGAPSVSGVPADRASERSTELEALFSRLADVQAQAEQIRAQAADEARRRQEVAQERAQAILADARRRLDAERASASAAGRARAVELATTIVTDARRAAADLDERARQSQPAYVDRVVARATTQLFATTETSS